MQTKLTPNEWASIRSVEVKMAKATGYIMTRNEFMLTLRSPDGSYEQSNSAVYTDEQAWIKLAPDPLTIAAQVFLGERKDNGN